MKGANKKLITILFTVLAAGAWLWFAQTVSAQPDLGLEPVGSAIGLPATDIRLVVANIIRIALGLLGIVALVLILYGGFIWMTAGGEEEKISTAKKILVNAAIGLAIILSSYAIASFVISSLTGATSGDGGLGGPGGGGGGDNPYFPAGIFYVDSLPSGGVLCVRNVHLAITFNKEVDIDTLNGNVVVQATDGTEQAGAWQLLSNTTAAFVPNGDCGSGLADCYAPSTAYTLHFKNGSAIKTSDGQMSLNCVIKAGCADVSFTTGEGVDRLPPQIKIESIAGDMLRVGSVVPVQVSYTDDNGVQKIDLAADNYFVGSQTVSGCQKTGSVTINWPTVGIASGLHTLQATGYDWSALSYVTSTNVSLLPQHCFDSSLQADLGEVVVGPPACGGECGACAGSPCTGDALCASGYCDPVAGVCVDKMRINGVSPLSGGPGTIVSVSGNYFGDNPGRVYFAETNKANLSRTTDSGWVRANLGCGANSWKTYQILAEVPSAAVSGPIQVIKDSPTSLWVGIGDFENSTDGFMTYAPGSFQSSADAKVGSKSLEVSSGPALNPGSTYGGAFVVMPALTVGQTYTISFWAKSLSANPALVSVSAQNGGGDTNCLSFNFTPTASWQKYSRTCKLDLVKNSLYIWGNAANQKLLVDGLKITKSEIDFTDYFVNPNTPESNWGPEISDFTVNTVVRPGLCSITPASDLAGAEVVLAGKNFGIAVDKVFFGLQSVPVIPVNWTDTLIKTRVPLLDAGAVGVRVVKNNLDSNSIKFFVEQGLSGTAPFISGITPDHGGKGEYITITGNNFGEQTGKILFKENVSGQPVDTIEGSFTFPPGCQNTWTDKQIIVKFPNNGIIGRSYFVQVRPADAALGTSPIGPEFDLQNVAPSPGVCNINPVSGPVPFAVTAPDMKIIGENFGLAPEVYFWAASASSTSIAGRMIGATTGVANLSVGQVISTRPLAGTLTGPVVVLRKPDDKLSNPQNFSTVNCVKNNNTCPDVDTHCCAVGSETGMCKPATELCEGETLSAGYIWRFSTKDIPKVPRVVERCNANTDLGANIPSPSPSASWDTSTSGVHHNVCRTAAVVVEFNLPTINNIARADFLINECTAGTVNEANRTCTVAGTVGIGGAAGDLIPQLSTENTSYLELNPDNAYNNGKWKDNTWYQVVLRSGITAGVGTSTAPLAKDKPCSVDSSYCFVFKADTQDCKMKQVVITPYSYRTSILEEPIKHRDSTADSGEDVVYSGHGLSTQHCIVMDTTAFNWSWGTKNIYYASIFSTNNASARVSSLANTVGVGLINPDNAINVTATATLASANYTGHSPLTVDLNNPQVVDFWPKCLESCTNAEVGVRFNTTMSFKNLGGGSVKLLKCNDENCFDTISVVASADISLDSASDYRVLKIANSGVLAAELEANTIYQVILSASTTDMNSPELLWSAARMGDPTTVSKPYNKQFTWRFKTKKEKCKISRVDVVPQNYFAEFINDKAIYSSQPYSSPDTCSATGQKLNPWTVGWTWESSLPPVARVTTFSTKGSNSYCTLGCTRKGSSVAVGTSVVSVCGNSIVEAGEDCDSPLKGAGCGLDCRRLGNVNSSTCGNGIIEPNLGETCDPGLPASAVGCGSLCLRSGSAPATGATDTGASICGNGFIGSGEDCDLGISASVSITNSSMNCSDKCLHQGTRLSNKWCFDKNNDNTFGGFTQAEFKSACRMAVSRCGDGVINPDEDADCDLGGDTKAAWCNDFCLVNTSTVPHAECVVGAQGCSAGGQHIGSSLLYTVPSVCGDQAVGIGEDNFCETNLPVTHTGVNPWSLVTGVGLGDATGVPPSQKTDISASTNEETVGGATMRDKGQFIISCGYKTDTECQDRMGDSWGVAANGCCYLRPQLLKVTPGNTTTAQANVCPNTAIEATFDQEIDLSSLKNNLVVARGIGATSTCVGTEDVTSLVVGNIGNNNLSWYKKIFVAVVNFFKNLVGENVSAVHNEIKSVKWCAGEDVGQASVLTTTSTLSKVIFKLNKPLAFDTDYFVALKDGLRSKKGISIGKNNITNKPLSWKFITGSRICEVDNVSVEPAQVYLNKVGATSTLVANAYNVSAAQIQPIPGYYAWDYLWQPVVNSFVNLQNTTSSVNIISAQNRNGEIDVRASAVITSNIYSSQFGSVATGKSHVIVFLCENPWPPKDLYLSGVGPYVIFPYEDKEGNNDGFNLAAGAFDNTSIPPSPSGRYFNFRSYYCADSGAFGTADDLPYLRPAVQVSSAIVSDSPTSSLKRFILTNAKNNDAVGIAVFSNPQHLTVAQWFATDRALGGQGFTGNMQTTKIDGYDALTDGNNIYVDALNYSDPIPPALAGNLYTNIYLFSINANAQPDTKKAFEAMISNLHFNTNLTNYGYCGATMANPGASTTCQTDLDCSGTEICSVQIDKLKRNYQRLRDLNEIQNLLGF